MKPRLEKGLGSDRVRGARPGGSERAGEAGREWFVPTPRQAVT